MSSYDRDDGQGPEDLRARLLAALLAARDDDETGDIVLLEHGPVGSSLIVPSKAQRIFLFSADEHTAPDALRALLAPIIKRSNRGGIVTHFVIVGGSDAVRAAVKKAIPTIQSGALGFHHVRDSGEVDRVGRVKLPLLERVAPHAPGTAPLDAAALEAELAAGQAFMRREQEVARKLSGRYRVTAVITVACAVLMGLSYLWGGGNWNLVLYRMGANSAAAVKEGEYYRLLSSAFLHADPIHLLFNMYAFWVFGTLLEALLGAKRYLVLYAASALGGSLASALLGSHALSVGASGAIWGLMTGGIGLALMPRGLLTPTIITQMRKRVWSPLVINALYSFRPGIDFLAHIGGGLVGFLLVGFVLTRGLKPVEARRDPADVEAAGGAASMGGAVLSVAAMAVSVALALTTGRPWAYGSPPDYARTQIGDTGVSMELPAAVTGDTSAAEVAPGLWLYSYGKLPVQPVVFEVIAAKLSTAVPPEQTDAFLEQERKDAEKKPPSGFKTKGAAERVTVGGRPAIYVAYEQENLEMRSYIVVLGDREIILRGYSFKERPSSWNDVEEKVAASIKTYSAR